MRLLKCEAGIPMSACQKMTYFCIFFIQPLGDHEKITNFLPFITPKTMLLPRKIPYPFFIHPQNFLLADLRIYRNERRHTQGVEHRGAVRIIACGIYGGAVTARRVEIAVEV